MAVVGHRRLAGDEQPLLRGPDQYALVIGKVPVEWVDARPQLAGSDHIHFTYAGSNRASEMLWEGLMEAYKLYKLRIIRFAHDFCFARQIK